MNTQQQFDEAAHAYRMIRRWIIILLVLYVPLLLGGFALNDLFHSELPATLIAIVFFAMLIYLSVSAFVSYYRLTGKYPFYWLKK